MEVLAQASVGDYVTAVMGTLGVLAVVLGVWRGIAARSNSSDKPQKKCTEHGEKLAGITTRVDTLEGLQSDVRKHLTQIGEGVAEIRGRIKALPCITNPASCQPTKRR